MEKESNTTIKDFTDLEVWQGAHKFILRIYEISKKLPKEELFGVTNQLRRASVSINANIAEGFGRWHYKDKTRFYFQARGSASEVYNLLIICRDLNYFNQEIYEELNQQIQKIRRMLNGLIKSIIQITNGQ